MPGRSPNRVAQAIAIRSIVLTRTLSPSVQADASASSFPSPIFRSSPRLAPAMHQHSCHQGFDHPVENDLFRKRQRGPERTVSRSPRPKPGQMQQPDAALNRRKRCPSFLPCALRPNAHKPPTQATNRHGTDAIAHLQAEAPARSSASACSCSKREERAARRLFFIMQTPSA